MNKSDIQKKIRKISIKPVGKIKYQAKLDKEKDETVYKSTDWVNNGSGPDSRDIWNSKTKEEQLDIIEASQYDGTLRNDSVFPFIYEISSEQSQNLPEEYKEKARRAAKKARKDNAAFMSGYTGKYYYYRPYYTVVSIFSKVKKRVRNVIYNMKKRWHEIKIANHMKKQMGPKLYKEYMRSIKEKGDNICI